MLHSPDGTDTRKYGHAIRYHDGQYHSSHPIRVDIAPENGIPMVDDDKNNSNHYGEAQASEDDLSINEKRFPGSRKFFHGYQVGFSG